MCSQVFSFLKSYAPLRQEKHLTVLEHLISALNIFLRSAAMNCRMRVCLLGEELLPSILYVWADMRPSAVLKEEIVDFFNLQICAHHPKGAKTQDTGRVVFLFFSTFFCFLVVLTPLDVCVWCTGFIMGCIWFEIRFHSFDCSKQWKKELD